MQIYITMNFFLTKVEMTFIAVSMFGIEYLNVSRFYKDDRTRKQKIPM